ncbi:hypothetical protein [Streptomyces sp. NPDC094032]|uniref:hypothetical protein n=1 Tax=Streptomyces sp. NPDC094032 TaxID=3155308 RepID=UPI00331A7801
MTAVLVAVRLDGAWMPAWFVEATQDGLMTSGYVDALTGVVIEQASAPPVVEDPVPDLETTNTPWQAHAA